MSKRKNRQQKELKEQEKQRLKQLRAEKQQKAQEHEAKIEAALSRPKKLTADIIDLLFSGRKAAIHPAVLENLATVESIITTNKPANPCLPKYSTLLKLIIKKAPKLAGKRFWAPLWILSNTTWSSTPETWQPVGRAPRTIFHSLATHLMVKHPVPKFLFSIFFLPHTHSYTYRLALVFEKIAGGASAFKTLSSRLVPVVMTRKMCHFFLASPANLDVYQAIRHAQVQAYAGERRLALALCSTVLGRRFMTNEDFWLAVIQWFSGRHMLDPVQVGPLIDYIAHLKRENPDFEIQGRSVFALLAAMRRWHTDLAIEKKLKGITYTPSGFKRGLWEYKQRNQEGGHIITTWSIDEIPGSKQLAEEGRAMHHCVYSYNDQIEEQKVSLWSLRKNGERMLTVEVSNITKTIVQARGRCNRLPDNREMDKLKRWAAENGLQIKLFRW